MARFGCTATLVHGTRICILGGANYTRFTDSQEAVASAHWLDLRSRSFSDGPGLNQPRAYHSSFLSGNKLYTFGGSATLDSDHNLDSIEILDVFDSEARWSIFTDRNFSARRNPLVGQLGPAILIAGGINHGYLTDAVFFDPDRKTFKKSETQLPFGFGSFNQARMIAPGKMIALAEKGQLCQDARWILQSRLMYIKKKKGKNHQTVH